MPLKAAKKGSAARSAPGVAAVNKNWEAALTREQFQEVCLLNLTSLFGLTSFICSKYISFITQSETCNVAGVITWLHTVVKLLQVA